MQFLCPEHKADYYQLPDELIMERWVNWMHQAGTHYVREQWDQALVFAGNAYDLAKIRLQKCLTETADAMAQLCLSAIYLSNIQQHMGHLCEGRCTLRSAGECLQCFASTRHVETANELEACMEYEHLRDQMIVCYLNLPYRPVYRGLASFRVH